MKLLINSLNYYPELTGIGKFSGDMAEWLAARGHEVRVVTAPPYYPEWLVGVGHSPYSYRRQWLAFVDVWRSPLWVPAQPSGLKRLIHLATFAVFSLPTMLRQIFWRPNVVWVVAPAFFSAPGALLTARLCRAPVWLHVQDFEVDAAFDLGLLKGAWLKKLVLGVELRLLQRFDVVSTISYRMKDRALTKGVAPERAVLFPNWVDISAINPDYSGGSYSAELGIPEGRLVALYSGNMGGKQGLDILAEAARLLVDDDRIIFVFCGNGAGRADLEMLCKGLPNVRFVDLQPLDRLGELLTFADIHLLPQRADVADLVMPSKLTGMLASGRPVVVTAHQGTEVARVVEGCGLVVEPESPEVFADAIAALAADPQQRVQFGLAARRYAETNLDKESVLLQFEAQLIELARKT